MKVIKWCAVGRNSESSGLEMGLAADNWHSNKLMQGKSFDSFGVMKNN